MIMRRVIYTIVVVLLGGGWVWGAEEPGGLSLATAEGLYPEKIAVTGRVLAPVSARLGARVSGIIVELGKNEAGQMLDAGMTVKAGQVLFRLEQTTFANAVAMAEAGTKLAQATLENLTAKTREEKLEQFRQMVAELDARIADRRRDEERFRRLVEEEKTLPARRLEEVQTELATLRALRAGAQARLSEAENGPTKTEIAVAAARVREAEVALKIAKDDYRDATVAAPFEGLITRRFKSPGDYITSAPPTEVLELVSMAKLEVELRISEAYYTAIEAGKTKVVIESPLLRAALSSTAARVVGDIDPSSGTFAVRIAVPAEERGGLVSGAFVTAKVALGGESRGVIVPIRAVVEEKGKSGVFVAEGGKMARREVSVGDRLTEGVIVKSGVKRGEKVVVGAAELLKDGAALPGYLGDGK